MARTGGRWGGSGAPRANCRNIAFSDSESLAIDVTEFRQFVTKIEKLKIVRHQLPVDGKRVLARVTNYPKDVRPIASLARGVVDKSLNLQTDEILEVNDGNGDPAGPWESRGTF